jgi:2-hydroxychromene-2-carboxylate isomerase/uncharacterized cupin superfamily protein
MPQATFYFDLGSPFAYLAAERLHDVLPASVQWQPVSLGALFKLTDRSSWGLGDPKRRQAGMVEIERRARLYGLSPVRWPDHWPGNYLMAMRAATFAYRTGHGREFTTQAFRSAFQEGLDLSVPAHVLQAAQNAGLDPQEVEQATQAPEIKLALREATDAAHSLGVFGVPTIAIDDELFWGDDRLEDAADHLDEAKTERRHTVTAYTSQMPNINDPLFDEPREHPGFRCLRARIGRQAGCERLGMSLWEVPPGEAAFPYHHHLAEEELLLVLDGQPSLRTPDGWRELTEGEVVAFLRGEHGGHQLVNRTQETVRFLAVSTSGEPDIVIYPDSGKVGAFERLPQGGGLRTMFRMADTVDYHYGEQPPVEG